MLDLLRTKGARSWVSLSILAIMALGLVFYFGYSDYSRIFTAGATVEDIATVNGEEISAKKFENIVENQLQKFGANNGAQLPPALLEVVRQNTLQQLIVLKIFARQARQMGLMVSNDELISAITSNPALSKDGMFDKKFYLQVYKPTYLQQTGEDYEKALTEELLAEKFEGFVKNSISVSEPEVYEEFLLSQTQLNLQKITVPSSNWGMSESAASQPESNSPAFQTKKQIEEDLVKVLQDKTAKNQKPLDTLKKKYSLKVEETGPHSLRDRTAFVGTPQASEALACIVKLNSENPTCVGGFDINGQWTFFKLISRKEPDLTQFESQKEALQKTLLQRKQLLSLQEIQKDLLSKAKIDSRLPPIQNN